MTQQYYDADAVDQEPGTSEEAGAVQSEPQSQPQQTTQDTEAFLRGIFRSELDYLNRRVQSLDSRMTNWQTEQMQRIAALAAQGEDTRGMLSDLHEVTIDPSERDRKALERRLSRAEAQQSQPQPQPQQTAPDGRLSEAQFEEVFRGENGIIDSLREWGMAHGIPAADFNAAWDMLNTNAAGAGVEYTTAGLRKYEAAMKKEITKYAQARFNAQKPQTRTQPVRAQGAPSRDWSATTRNAKSLNDFSDADYEAFLNKGTNGR